MNNLLSYIYLLLFLTTALNSSAVSMVDSTTSNDVLPLLSLNSNYQLVFSDEFNGDLVNEVKWNIDNSSNSRASRPGLGISQWYWRPSNVKINNGNLVLEVIKASNNVMHCGSINSRDKFEVTYGYFEVSMKIANASKGTHTAFWLQGQNMNQVDGTANDGAEIDIFESAWLEDYTKSVVHIDGYGSSHKANTKKYLTPNLHEGYHTFGFHWTPDFMKIYYDGVLKVTYSASQWIVNSEEFLWLSNGASFGFEGDYFTQEPVGYLTEANVEYIRVWQENDNSLFTNDKISKSEYLIYPNPTQKDVTISTDKMIKTMQLFDISGNCLKQNVNVSKSKVKLSLKGLPKGSYLIALSTEDGNTTHKLIYE